MTMTDQPGAAGGLSARVKAILMRPAATWPVIEAEPATIKGLYTGYVMPLAAIGPVCMVIGRLVFGSTGALGLAYRPPVARVLGEAVLQWVLALAGIYVFALIIEALAPRFEAQASRLQAFKLAAYSSTAAWVAGVFAAFPPLAPLSLVGLYSLYLLHVGAPPMTKVAADKHAIFTVCLVLAGLAVGFLVSILAGVLLSPLLMLTAPAPV